MTRKSAKRSALEKAMLDLVPENLQESISETMTGLKRDEGLAVNVFGMGLGYLAATLRQRLPQEEAEALLIKIVGQQVQFVLTSELTAPSSDGDESDKPS